MAGLLCYMAKYKLSYGESIKYKIRFVLLMIKTDKLYLYLLKRLIYSWLSKYNPILKL